MASQPNTSISDAAGNEEKAGSDPLLGNKIAAAILVALLLAFGLPHIADFLTGASVHHGDHELHLAYPIEFETGPVGAEAAPRVDLGTLLAAASAAGGERRAALCRSCHTFERGGASSTGPNLWNVVGREVATYSGFNYTPALKAYGGVWTYERLDAYIANSQAEVPGTAMVQRFPRDDQRADILAYLATLSENPVPFPEPAPAEAAGTDIVDNANAAENTPAAEPEADAPADNETVSEEEPQGDDVSEG